MISRAIIFVIIALFAISCTSNRAIVTKDPSLNYTTRVIQRLTSDGVNNTRTMVGTNEFDAQDSKYIFAYVKGGESIGDDDVLVRKIQETFLSDLSDSEQDEVLKNLMKEYSKNEQYDTNSVIIRRLVESRFKDVETPDFADKNSFRPNKRDTYFIADDENSIHIMIKIK